MGLLYGRAGRLTAENGGSRPGQFCPNYESDPASLSEAARVQMLRGIGVAIVKHGSMFPTMEMMLRHAVNYLGPGCPGAVERPLAFPYGNQFCMGLFSWARRAPNSRKRRSPAPRAAACLVHDLVTIVKGY
jgi:hypothetical protein